MAKIYAKRILAGLMTLEDVPDRWRKEVEERLKQEEGAENE